MVGDQDQCIYTIRGSNLANIKTFIDTKNPKNYQTRRKLSLKWKHTNSC